MAVALPVMARTILGILIALLGLFAAGNIWLIVTGLAAIAVAG